MEAGARKRPKSNLTRSSSTTPLWRPEPVEDPHDDLVNFSSFHHRAYVQSLLAPEKDLQEAAGSMYGRSTIGSEKTANVYIKASKGGGTTASGSEAGRYLGSTLNTTISMSSSSAATDYTRHPTEYEYNPQKDQRPRIHTQFSAEPERPKSNLWGKPSGPRTRTPSDQTDLGPKRPPLKSRYSSREGFLVPPGNNNNNNKLTWNSATTSYTTTSAAQPMTGASPTPSTWEYVVYPQRHIWPTIKGTYLLIARLPLRILVAVLTTLVLCFDVLLVIGAAETVFAVPVSCLLGAMAYPGAAQFDNTMNVARAMHTVNLVLIVVILPTVVCITVLHQIRMIQKYNWCLRLLRTGNYGFVPGGRGKESHFSHIKCSACRFCISWTTKILIKKEKNNPSTNYRVHAASEAPSAFHWLHCRVWRRRPVLHGLPALHPLHHRRFAPRCRHLPLLALPHPRLARPGRLWNQLSPCLCPLARPDARHQVPLPHARLPLPHLAPGEFPPLGVLLGIFQYCLWCVRFL